MNGKCIAVLASPRTRQGRDSQLLQFLYLYGQHLWAYEIHATRGTYEVLARTGLLSPAKLRCVRAAAEGGVVDIAQRAIDKQYEAVILLLDPRDSLSDSAENLALQRACISKGIPQLMNPGDLEHWIAYEASRDLEDRPADVSVRKSDEVVALVAHDGTKAELLGFFADYAGFLIRKHHELIATGTTGTLIRELYKGSPLNTLESILSPRRWSEISKDEQLRREWPHWLQTLNRLSPGRTVTAHGDKGNSWQLQTSRGDVTVLTNYESGPDGGDVRIASRVMEGTCNAILFFHDPTRAHPHDADIRLCIRTCQLSGISVTLRRDRQSAARWVNGCIQGRRIEVGDANRLHYKEAEIQALVFGHLEHSVPDTSELGVGGLARACAGYLDEALQELLAPQQATLAFRRVLILLAWGSTLRSVADSIQAGVPVTNEGQVSAGTFRLRRGSYGVRLTIGPLIGVTGEEGKWRTEASAIARDVAGAYEGSHFDLSSPAFFSTHERGGIPPGVKEIRDTLRDHLNDPESYVMIVTTVAPYQLGQHGADLRNRYPWVRVPEATAETCGIFLKDGLGRVPEPVQPQLTDALGENNTRLDTLVGYDDLRQVASRAGSSDRGRGEVVVICGYDADRVGPLSTMIKAGIVNTLITDAETLKTLRARLEEESNPSAP